MSKVNNVDISKLKEIVTRPIPEQLIKTREGLGKRTFFYLAGSTYIDMLNEAFNYLWDWQVVEQWVQESVPKFNPKYDKEPVSQGPVAHVRGILTAYIPNSDGTFFKITKSGFGAQPVLGGQTEQESIFKSAETDAIKNSAKKFGFGLQLYRDEEEQQYFNMLNYEDPWTDEMLEKFSKERDYLQYIMEKHGLQQIDLDELVIDWSKGMLTGVCDITPDNIAAFVEWLKESEEASENAK